jgi:hypothetical protein
VPDTANFLRETFRELGSIKGERRHYMNIVQHEEPKGLSANEKAVRTKFWSDVNAQKLLRSIVRLQRSNPLFSVEDAREDLEEAEDLSLSKTKVNGLLSKFCTSNLIEKDRKDAEDWYCVSKINQNRLIHFMNADFGWYPDSAADDGLEYDSSDDDIDTSIEPESEPSLPADVTETSSDMSDSETCLQDSARSAYKTPSNKRSNESINNCHVVTPPAGVGTNNDCLVEFSDTDGKCVTPTPSRSKKRATKAPDTSSKKQRIVSQPMDMNKNIVTQRIAKIDGSNVIFGDVVGQYDRSNSWWIQWDNLVNVEYGERDLQEGFRLYIKHQSNDSPRGFSKARASRYGSSDIPMVWPEDDFVTGRCIVQSGLNRRVYYAARGDTPFKIATKFQLMAKDIVQLNKTRPEYGDITQKREFKHINSPVLLPL